MRRSESTSILAYNSIITHLLLSLYETVVRSLANFAGSILCVLAYIIRQLFVAIFYAWSIIWLLSVYMTVKLSVYLSSKLSSIQQAKTHESSFELPVNLPLLNQVVKIFQCLQWNINPAYFSKFFTNTQFLHNAGTIIKNLFKMVFKVQF